MKKLLLSLTLGLFLMLNVGVFVGAEPGEPEEPAIIEVYPYDNLDCHLGLDSCPGYNVGSDDWSLQFNGYNYHFVRGSVRYGSLNLIDKDGDGYIDKAESGAPSWNAFGMLFINDTDATIKLRDGDRTGLTGVQHRMYAHFDEQGVIQMYENHISTFHIVNDTHGTEGAEHAWRLATELEKEAYDAAAADAKPANMLLTHVRIIRDSENANGYKLEPLGYLNWTSSFYNSDDPESKKSQFLEYDPNEVHIPAGWRIMTFGTLDRDSRYKPSFDMVLSLPSTFLSEEPEKAVIKYNEVPATFNGFGSLDDNPYIAGVQSVAKYGQPYKPATTGLSATWMKMFDDEGKIIKKTEHINFQLEVSKGNEVLETIDFTYDDTTKEYTPSGSFSKIDVNKFEEMYTLKMKAKTPKEVEAEVEGVIVVGVLPNRFEGVSTKFGEDGKYINLVGGIKAYSGEGDDLTDKIQISYPDNFNPYNPVPGTYEITLDVAHQYYWPEESFTFEYKDFNDNTQTAVDALKATFYTVAEDGTETEKFVVPINYPSRYNKVFNKALSVETTYIDYDHKELIAQASNYGWGTTAGVFNSDGILIHTWSGLDGYKETKIDGTVIEHASVGDMEASLQAYELKKGEFALLGHGTPWGQGMRKVGDKVVIEKLPIFYTANAQVKYNVTIDDKTAPVIKVVNSNYKVDKDMFETAEDAILANVVGWDNFSDVDFIVDDSGGLDLNVPGVYTVMVTVEDKAANDASVTFTVEVVAAKMSEAEVTELLDAQKDALEAVIQEQQELIQSQKDALEALQGQVDTTLPNDNKEYTDGKVAEANAAAAAAEARAQAAEDKAAELQTQIDAINAKPAAKSGVQLWVVILLVLIGSGAAFGAAFLFGKKQ